MHLDIIALLELKLLINSHALQEHIHHSQIITLILNVLYVLQVITVTLDHQHLLAYVVLATIAQREL